MISSVADGIGRAEQLSAQQALLADQIETAIEQISAIVQSNAATAEENSAISEEMAAQALLLGREVGRFKLEECPEGTRIERLPESAHFAGELRLNAAEKY